MSSIKLLLYQYCQKYLTEKRASVEGEIRLLQQQSNEETKSSAGDKYETTRAMIHLEIEKFSSQLDLLNKQQLALDAIKIDKTSDTVRAGSVVITDQVNYFLSISAGSCSIEGKEFICVSSSSPIAMKMMNLRTGDSFSFNKVGQRITSVQ